MASNFSHNSFSFEVFLLFFDFLKMLLIFLFIFVDASLKRTKFLYLFWQQVLFRAIVDADSVIDEMPIPRRALHPAVDASHNRFLNHNSFKIILAKLVVYTY